MKNIYALIGILFLCLLPTLTNAQATTCATATSITINGACSTNKTLTDTTIENGNLGYNCSGTITREGWYTFTVTAGPQNISIVGVGNNRNIALQLLSGTCGSLTQIACANATTTNGTQTETLNTASPLANGTYYIRVLNVGTNDLTLTSLCVTSAPANNSCANATTLNCGTTNLAGTTIGTNGSTNHGTTCSMSNNGVWYKFTGDGQETTISTTAAAGYDHEMSISSGTCGSFTNLTCQDSGLSGGTETYTFVTTAGVNYFIYIAYWTTGTTTGNFTISRSCTPTYNPCSSIANISDCGVSTTATIAAGNGSYSTSACGFTTPGKEIIYTFTPSVSGNYSIIQSASFGYIDYQFKAVSGGCSSTGWTCIDDLTGAATSANFALTAGTQYYLLLDPESSTGGSASFTINCPVPAPINDDCAGAITLPVTSLCNYVTYTNAGTTASSGVPAPGCASYSGGDVWFKIIVPSTGIVTIDTQTGSVTDGGMAIYTGNCGGLNLLSCDDDSSANGLMPSLTATGLTPGATIYVRFWEFGNDNNGTFGICVTTPGPPSNDDCANAIALAVNPTTTCTIPTNSTTSGATSSMAGCVGGADDDVWFTFEAYDTNHMITVTPGSMANAVIQVFSGTCGALTSMNCVNNTTGASNESITLTGLTVGTIYYIRVYTFSTGASQGTFSICVTTPCLPGSGNGNNSTGCPTNVAGGLGLNGSDPTPITACGTSSCTTLEATYKDLGNTSTYTVSSIPYAPPYQYGCLANSISINVDDVWSGLITLPFNFCFYGNTYSNLIIGSNGVVSFNTTNNTPGGYNNWSFSNNLPSTSLFLNSIFGVYHDIDPSKGGEVGWELVTMPSGCRAMIIGWNEVPMFSSTCNNLLYTGMIVLYENTNIIDVYVREKRVCPTWNSGNAVIGIQNNTATQAVVAPNRNSLDPDWTTTNEAWRFMPAGPSITTVTWFEGAGTSGPVVGTTPTINVCPTATTTYTARIRYTFCNGAVMDVLDDTTVNVEQLLSWNGSVDTDWNKPNNWTPNSSIPEYDDCVIIPVTANNPIISGSNYKAYAGNLIIRNGATLTVVSNNSLTVTDWITVEPTATFNIQNNASLVQINNVANTGNINYTRNALIRKFDYVYWSSPVAGFNTSNIGAPTTTGYIWKWNPTIANTNGGQGNWEMAVGNTMTTARGYIARGPDSFNNTTASLLVNTFTGVPNNGTITAAISRGSDTNTAYHAGTNGTEINNYSDNWNLLGNPYPSSIRASQFLFNNRTKIMGNIKIWTHGTLPSQIASPFYNTYQYNYSPGDYLTYNFTGTSCCPAASSDYFIGAGQGFFVQMIDGPATSDVVTFNNGLRSNTYDNSNFYRSSDYIIEPPVNVNIERHRFWLDIVNSNLVSDRTLVGYVQGATQGKDNFFDSNTLTTGAMSIFTLIGTDKFQIQGRALPFNSMDEVPVGIVTPSAGFYNIALAAVDGMFQSQNIYIRDKDLNIIHNLKSGPYRFYSTTGTRTNRFIIIYDYNLRQEESTLSNEIAIVTNETITVQSTTIPIETITVRDLLGRVLGTFEGNNEYSVELINTPKNKVPLIIQTQLANGTVTTDKIIF
ncbi:pre-peptidase C-terminal domain-containing protein [Flavobacterium sp. N1719]|uniref:pre-peptidase C-terminal domain-containing protein n=1 Tax=Flavobacterium sp. N1719 TaxID=2885633 RepID=UPI002223911C|nr:pre-peptidase C-terminal domain-containing protein [Flavobacterium sp. N1719]